MGYRIPAMIATVFARYVSPDTSRILDAGCGGGIQAAPLAMLSYGPIVGFDLSEDMREVAQSKKLYSELKQATLGETLDFPNNHFGAIYFHISLLAQSCKPPRNLTSALEIKNNALNFKRSRKLGD